MSICDPGVNLRGRWDVQSLSIIYSHALHSAWHKTGPQHMLTEWMMVPKTIFKCLETKTHMKLKVIKRKRGPWKEWRKSKVAE